MRARFGALIALALLSAACQLDPRALAGKPVPARGGQYTEAIVGNAGILNPLFAQEENARDINSLLYQGLVGVNAGQDIVPVLAREWIVSPDGLTYAFRVRADVRWADGEPFGVDDVLFTYGLLQDPAYSEPGAAFWREVKVSAEGDTVRFALKAPSAAFPVALTIGIIPRHAFRGLSPSAVSADPHSGPAALGTGPFLVESIARDRRTVTLKRNPYAAAPAFLDRVVFRSYPTQEDATGALLGGQVDGLGGILPAQLQSLRSRPDLEIHSLRTYTFVAALFALRPENAPLFDPVPVRQALVQGIDRAAIVKNVLGGYGEPAPGPIPPSDWAYKAAAADRAAHDPKAAAQALEASGWLLTPGSPFRSKGGRSLTIDLVTTDAYPYRQVADLIAEQLRSIGVEIRVEGVAASALVSRYLIGRNFQMAVAAFDNGPDPDQFALWHSGQPKDSVTFGDSLPRQALIDKDLEDGRATTDRRRRAAAYADFQDLMADAAPAAFLYEPHYLYAVARRVKGFRTDAVIEPAGRFAYISSWYLNTRVH